jgi:MSHA pilin protein MshD
MRYKHKGYSHKGFSHRGYSYNAYRIKTGGFTLVESIVGIVVLAISFSVLTALIYPIAEQSAEQLHQVKAAELGQSVLNEIQNKAFDENSDRAGGAVRCSELSQGNCSTTMGSEGESRSTFDDVDDYNGLEYGSVYNQADIENSTGQTLAGYSGYSMRITVANDQNFNGSLAGNNLTAKLITVIITTPTGNNITFATYRANF